METENNIIVNMSDETSQDIGLLAQALSKAQGQICAAKKDQTNPFYKSKYADLSGIVDAIREPLSKNELAYIQTTKSSDQDTVTVITRLIHSSGQWIKGELSMTPTKKDPQGIGSAITYARRYSLAAMVGVVQEDDDGNAASAPKTNQSEIKKQTEEERINEGFKLLKFSDTEKETLLNVFQPTELLAQLQNIAKKKMTKDDLFKIVDLKLENKDENN